MFVAKCSLCGKDELLPFICPYCGGAFCAEHHLPENHNCPGLSRRAIPSFGIGEKSHRRKEAKPSIPRTSLTEIIHLSIAFLVFLLVEGLRFHSIWFTTTILPTLGISALTAFAIHELAHKFTAQYYGMWAEFRLNPMWAGLSLITAIPWVPVKIIATGAVTIYAYRVTVEENGKIALAGPLSNIALTLALFSLGLFYPTLRLAAVLNVHLAMFNLIPISILDGRKVFDWSKTVWIIVFASALALYFLV
jgi:Zn-dependent protease